MKTHYSMSYVLENVIKKVASFEIANGELFCTIANKFGHVFYFFISF